MFKKVSQFFVNVANEMKKVRWPTKKELVKYTITVIVTVTFVTLFFVVVDFGISSLLKWITGQTLQIVAGQDKMESKHIGEGRTERPINDGKKMVRCSYVFRL